MKKVELGKTGVYVSPIAFGTGAHGYKGVSDLTRLAYDTSRDFLVYGCEQGITFLDTAMDYGTHRHVKGALEELKKSGIDRSEVEIASKVDLYDHDTFSIRHELEPYGYDRVTRDVDRCLRELGTDYIDIMLLHCMTEYNWITKTEGARDALRYAKENGKVKAIGLSIHNSPEVLPTIAGDEWTDVILVRLNRYGNHMDSTPEVVVPFLEEIHEVGKGVYAMKPLGLGDLVDLKEECIEYLAKLPCVDAMAIGMESEKQILENIILYNKAMRG